MRLRTITLAMTLLASPLANTLAAQRNVVRLRPRPAPEMPSMLQSVTLGVADAMRERYSATIEPLVFGRFSIGLSGEYSTARGDDGVYAYPEIACAGQQLCTSPPYPYPVGDDRQRSREWSFAARARWYPAALSRANARQSVAAYVGEFLAYRERSSSEVIYYPCPYCAAPYPDSGPAKYPYPGGSTTTTTTVEAWEPGAELGVRVVAARHLVIDVGGTFRLVRLDDYRSRLRRGDVDSRLTVAIGVGW